MAPEPIVLCNSGGPDARLVGALARAEGLPIHSLFIDYNPHCDPGARDAARRTAELLRVESHVEMWMPFDFIGQNDDLYGQPHSNIWVAQIGAAYAYKLKVKWLWMGTARDADRDDYLLDFQHILNRTKNPDIVFVRPLSLLADHRDFVVEKAAELGVSLEDTWSCNHSHPACGGCFKCRRRKRYGWRNC